MVILLSASGSGILPVALFFFCFFHKRFLLPCLVAFLFPAFARMNKISHSVHAAAVTSAGMLVPFLGVNAITDRQAMEKPVICHSNLFLVNLFSLL